MSMCLGKEYTAVFDEREGRLLNYVAEHWSKKKCLSHVMNTLLTYSALSWPVTRANINPLTLNDKVSNSHLAWGM